MQVRELNRRSPLRQCRLVKLLPPVGENPAGRSAATKAAGKPGCMAKSPEGQQTGMVRCERWDGVIHTAKRPFSRPHPSCPPNVVELRTLRFRSLPQRGRAEGEGVSGGGDLTRAATAHLVAPIPTFPRGGEGVQNRGTEANSTALSCPPGWPQVSTQLTSPNGGGRVGARKIRNFACLIAPIPAFPRGGKGLIWQTFMACVETYSGWGEQKA